MRLVASKSINLYICSLLRPAVRNGHAANEGWPAGNTNDLIYIHRADESMSCLDTMRHTRALPQANDLIRARHGFLLLSGPGTAQERDQASSCSDWLMPHSATSMPRCPSPKHAWILKVLYARDHIIFFSYRLATKPLRGDAEGRLRGH